MRVRSVVSTRWILIVIDLIIGTTGSLNAGSGSYFLAMSIQHPCSIVLGTPLSDHLGSLANSLNIGMAESRDKSLANFWYISIH